MRTVGKVLLGILALFVVGWFVYIDSLADEQGKAERLASPAATALVLRGFVVARDRVELSTPRFSVLREA